MLKASYKCDPTGVDWCDSSGQVNTGSLISSLGHFFLVVAGASTSLEHQMATVSFNFNSATVGQSSQTTDAGLECTLL